MFFINFNKCFKLIVIILIAITSFQQVDAMEHKTQKDLNNRLIYNVRLENIEDIRKAIAEGADVNAPDVNNRIPLSLAVQKGNLDIFNLLIASGAHLNRQILNELLVLAARHGHVKFLQELISKDANINDNYFEGKTALIAAAITDKLDIVLELIKLGADLDIRATDTQGNTALMSASLHNHVNIVLALVQAGADLDITNNLGRTALMIAARAGNLKIVKILVQNGANLNIVTPNDGSTALSLAITNNNDEIVKYLAAAGSIAIGLEDLEHVRSGRQILKEILNASKISDYHKFKKFADNGYSLNIQDEFGNTPLHHAVRNNDRAMIYLILRRPYGIKLLHVNNNDGKTPMELAAGFDENLLHWIVSNFFGKKRTVYEDEL